MPNFRKPDIDDDDHSPTPARDEVHEVEGPPPPPPPPRPISVLPPANPPPPQNNPSSSQSSAFRPGGMGMGAQAQVDPQVGLAQAAIDAEIAKSQMAKQDEHWAKSYWRPAMGWLYMVICAFDFVLFPLITIFLPIIQKTYGIDFPYSAWQSLTLSNGGLIHMAFGAILGVAAWTRGQEKVANINGAR